MTDFLKSPAKPANNSMTLSFYLLNLKIINEKKKSNIYITINM